MSVQAAAAVEMTVKGLILDPSSKTPIVILRHEESKALLPIWIILWAGRKQVWTIPLVLVILISPWIYDALKANQGHANPVEQFTTPLGLLVLLTYQWIRSRRGSLHRDPIPVPAAP